nr:hypothetical protein [uncultured Holophaga sp.]
MKTPLLCMALSLSLSAAPLGWPEASRILLEAYDQDHPLPRLEVTRVDQPQLRWLRACASGIRPMDPFRRGSASWREAEAIRALLQAPPALESLHAVPLDLTGSRMAFWRWGQALVRHKAMSREQRRAWEDRLMDGPADLLRTYGLRHALCFALAEGDLDRFQAIQARTLPEDQDFLALFQGAFPLIGGPCPALRLWTLPGLEAVEQPLPELAPKGAWIAPLAVFPTPPPEGWLWIIPTRSGHQPHEEWELDGPSREEGVALARQLKGRKAFLAPSGQELESLVPSLFPIRLDFGDDGTLKAITLGDAARVEGGTPHRGLAR